MPDPRDPIDTWLDARVQPLPPPPGTFERIRRQARRKKTGRALMSAVGAAIVVAAAVAAPSIASSLRGQPAGPFRPTAQGTGASLHTPRSPTPSSQASSHVQPPASTLPDGYGAPPDNFQPTSVTFVGPHTGAVIGQAGTPGHCATRYCTSLAGTRNYGATWFGVNAPLAGAPEGSTGVGQIRFLDVDNGWAFGPALWVTHDGGAHWRQENTFGLRVTDLEAAGNRAFALLATCAGTGSDYAADCTGVSLYSSLASSNSDQWTQVPGPTANLLAATGQPASASLVLAGGNGYLLAPSGELLSGPLTGAAWTVASPAVPCALGAPGPAGQPTSALLAADSTGLALLCTATTPGVDAQLKTVYESSDGGSQWSLTSRPPATGVAESLAAGPGGQLVLATDAGIYRCAPGGISWALAQANPASAASGETGFTYVGMTSTLSGVALPADPSLNEVFTTSDGGLTWQPRLVSAP
jgi:hypothetical protein